MRYWCLKLRVNHGEADYRSFSIHKTNDEIPFVFDAYMKSLSPDGGGSDDEGYYMYNNGEVCCSVVNYYELTKDEYEFMEKMGV